MVLFNRVTIVGLGLIGGSLGMAIRRHRLARRVIGLSRKASTLREAARRGAIDEGTTNPLQAVGAADVVVIATPVEAVVPIAQRLAPFMPARSILTDVASTKGGIVRALERSMPSPVSFIGGHPLAGSEQSGIRASRAELFEGSLCLLTATARTDRRALHVVRRLWTPLVRRVVVMDPQRHDRLVAAVSHLPHLLAFCLVGATPPRAVAIAPRSFLEATRVARSDPTLWSEIFFSNSSALVTAGEQFDRRWRLLRDQLVHGDRAALGRFLRRAQVIRHALRD